MKLLIYNITLAFVWAVLNGAIDARNLAVGFILGYVVLGAMKSSAGTTNYFLKVKQVLGFTLLFLKEMVVSSLRVAHDILTPSIHARPGIVAIPLDARTDAEIALLANVITLTPGTLSLDVSSDRSKLYIHAMFVDDADQLREEIKNGLEKKLLEVMR